ncbi:nuclear transport factor 2 family protein [Kordiimonas pumila]|uniref:Nuclear transport factor 2 family protein n=1 Tax=Kordiimonas pumila TaxID=2161677 RepID=A0ABV7D669_9PROT|nr:nuclear transport factor 2 family protein [Kordiimonas pumila]
MTALSTLKTLISSWKAGDIETILAQLADDVVYHYHIGSPPLEGKTAVKAFLDKFGSGQTNINWRLTNYAETGNAVLVEGIDDYVNAEGVHIQMPYMGILELKDGLVIRWRDYFDSSLLQKVKEGGSQSMWTKALRDIETAS